MRNKFAVVWIWICLLPLAFDFKGVETASKAIQILLTVPSMLAGCRSPDRAALRGPFAPARADHVALSHHDSGQRRHASAARQRLGQLHARDPAVRLMLLGYFVGCRPWDAQRLEQLERAMMVDDRLARLQLRLRHGDLRRGLVKCAFASSRSRSSVCKGCCCRVRRRQAHHEVHRDALSRDHRHRNAELRAVCSSALCCCSPMRRGSPRLRSGHLFNAGFRAVAILTCSARWRPHRRRSSRPSPSSACSACRSRRNRAGRDPAPSRVSRK